MASILHTKQNTLNTLNNITGASGQFLTAGLNGTSYTTATSAWASPNTNFSSTNGTAVMTIPFGEDKVRIEKSATLEIKGNVVINGMDLDERLKTIEQVLCIPQRDVTMETKHPKLKQLYEQYMHELEKYKTWDRIKGDSNGTT
jgi:hypothetical protein